MEGDFIKINKWLTPLSWFYGIGVRFRNFLFDVELRKSRTFKTPVIAVGNITVGGTGKTPHVEYLIRLLLQEQMKVAVLSRGYKRKSHGFIIADKNTDMHDIGDEPFQMKHKFPDVTVAVDKKRVQGILKLTNGDTKDSNIDVILLDDAFQHRQVKPGINILLVDYHRLVIYDELLPAGRLREPLRGKDRADIVIITKCPKDLKPMEFRVITKAMSLYPYQQLFFSTINYEELQPVFSAKSKVIHLSQLSNTNVLLLSGIASPRQMIEDLTPLVKSLTPLTFGDHHDFSEKDISQLNALFEQMPTPKIIVTTEKDAARLMTVNAISNEVRQALYQLPINISFLQKQTNAFNQSITSYVNKNARKKISKMKEEQRKKTTQSSETHSRIITFKNY